MTRFRLDLAYDGTHFEGWQSQRKGGRTVQGEIESALGKILKRPIGITGAGRTDSGVHARSQTAHFTLEEETSMKGANFLRGLNSLLPQDIRIIHCDTVAEDFHSRFSALARVYQYYLLPSQTVFPWESPYVWRINKLPDLRTLNLMAQNLLGERDFTTFCHAQDPSPSKCRFIYHASFFPFKDKVVFKIAGNAFLWRMVRSLVGSLLEYALEDNASGFIKALESKDRGQAGTTAPAQGLFLHKVVYHESEFSF